MSKLPARQSNGDELFRSRCPMCGVKCTPDAESCGECGEVFKEEETPSLPNEPKLRALIRALLAMHVFVGIFLMFVGLLFLDVFGEIGVFSGSRFDHLIALGSIQLSLGNFFVVPGVYRREFSALRLSMVCSALTAICCFLTVCLIVLGLLLSAGILQAHRISKLLREQEKTLESAV